LTVRAAAQRFRCASAIFFRVEALNGLRFRVTRGPRKFSSIASTFVELQFVRGGWRSLRLSSFSP
jgi:hypothetical protein